MENASVLEVGVSGSYHSNGPPRMISHLWDWKGVFDKESLLCNRIRTSFARPHIIYLLCHLTLCYLRCRYLMFTVNPVLRSFADTMHQDGITPTEQTKGSAL
jgi:hypothetical protein